MNDDSDFKGTSLEGRDMAGTRDADASRAARNESTGPNGGATRNAMLERVRRARPSAVPLPDIDITPRDIGDQTTAFMAAVEAAAGHAVRTPLAQVADVIAEVHPDAVRIAAPGGFASFAELSSFSPEEIDVLVCNGTLGVAENGAIWLPSSRMGVRSAPFLAQHLVLVVSEEDLVADMHDAYRRIRIDAEGFGVFVAGPSKTADIEQSLVIGAHGPRSLTVVVVTSTV